MTGGPEAVRPFLYTAMTPDLSVVIPTLNEAGSLPDLLADLAAQTGPGIEILISDGGSVDGTRELAAAAMKRLGLDGTVVSGAAGRGRQLNRGAVQARGAWLLFLHADSRLPSPVALAAALACLDRRQDPRVAGHFALRFTLGESERSPDYYRCEVKARLGLPGTIHGDQGFMLKAAFFRELGGFREDLPVLEDTLLAEKIRARGAWCLLPATIFTSPRRFRTEGFAARQEVNALLVNFAMIGWDAPFHRVAAVYPVQREVRPLEPAAFFRAVAACLDELPLRERLRVWYHTGRFVQANAWQLMLRHTVRRAFAAGCPSEAVPLQPIQSFARCSALITAHPPGYLAAALLTWLWFRHRCRQSARGG
ncbi:MAG: glycosyltransferase [Deltaproteobacteria bacterium]|nr:MAG: glycosyltransferase [Deltaproteobacteria bacterium]